MSRFRDYAIAAVVLFAAFVGPAAAADPVAGEAIFKACKACHMVGVAARNRVGPVLNGVVGRPAAVVAGFMYSPAMLEKAAAGLVWDEASLSSFLRDPKGFLKGTRMAFGGVGDEADVADLLAYLASFDEAGATRDAEAPAAIELRPEETAAEPAPTDPEVVEEPAMAGDGGLMLGLGRLATADEVAAWDIDVRPDGVGLPDGGGTVAQGMAIFDEQCAACHGDFGEAIDRWPVLAGGQGTLADDRPVKTIGSYWPFLSTVYDYVHRAMPFGNARSLSSNEVYALTAYLLYLNDIVQDEDFELSKENFADIELPNAPNFIDDDRSKEPHYADRSEPCMADCKPGEAVITMHAAVLNVTPEDSGGEGEAPAAGIE